MSDIVAVQLIVSITTLLAIVVTSLVNRKAVKQQNVVLEQTHAAVNSNHTKLEERLDKAMVVISELRNEVERMAKEGVTTPKRAATGVIVEHGVATTASERAEEKK